METATSKSCKVEGCKRPYRAKGYCVTHFKKWRSGEMPKKTRYKTCSAENCRKPLFRFGRCEAHYAELLKIKRGELEAPKEAKVEEKPKEEKPKEGAKPEKPEQPEAKKE